MPDPHAIDQAIYEELRRDAQRMLGRHAPGHSVSPSILVHDAYMRLAAGGTPFSSELHFRAAAALAMRHVLVDRARRRDADKRGGGWERVTLADGITEPVSVDIIAVSDALEALAAIDAEGATIVQMRFFGELTNEDIATAMGLSLRAVERGWRAARAWLFERLSST